MSGPVEYSTFTGCIFTVHCHSKYIGHLTVLNAPPPPLHFARSVSGSDTHVSSYWSQVTQPVSLAFISTNSPLQCHLSHTTHGFQDVFGHFCVCNWTNPRMFLVTYFGGTDPTSGKPIKSTTLLTSQNNCQAGHFL